MITAKLKSSITFFASGAMGHGANFSNINSGVQTLPISAHEKAPMRAFSILQKWPKMAKMTLNDILTSKIVLTEPPRNTRQNTLLVS